MLRKLGYSLSKQELEAVVQCAPNAIEYVLNKVQVKMAKYRASQANRSATPDRTPSSARSHRSASPSVRRGASPASVRSEGRPLGERAWGNQAEPSREQSRDHRAPPRKQTGNENEAQSSIVREKDQQIDEYKQTIEILELKITKLEQLVRLKDSKITKLQAALHSE